MFPIPVLGRNRGGKIRKNIVKNKQTFIKLSEKSKVSKNVD